MFEISKTFTFAAAHHLPQLPLDHKCRRVHGHNYAITFHLAAAELDDRGMVTDYGDLAPIARWIAADLDHRDLNDVMPEEPTAEHLARWAFERWKGDFPLAAVTVKETPRTSASYRP